MKAILLLFALVFAVGCGGCLKDGSSAVNSATVTGSYTPDSGQFSVGVTLTFKSPPTAETDKALLAAGALHPAPLVYEMPSYNRKVKAHAKAVELALKEGATLTGYTP